MNADRVLFLSAAHAAQTRHWMITPTPVDINLASNYLHFKNKNIFPEKF
jgi:hypothetical protein